MKEITKLRIFAAGVIVSLVLSLWSTYDGKLDHKDSILRRKY